MTAGASAWAGRPSWTAVLGYHLRLAAGDVGRNRALSLAIFAGLAMATAMWSNAIFHYQRIHSPLPDLDPGLHQVELYHARTAGAAAEDDQLNMGVLAARTRVSHPEYQRLAGSGVPGPEVATTRARLLIAAGAAATGQVVPGRFASAAFFSVFPQPLRAGRGFTAAEEAAGEAVVVMGRRLNDNLFAGADSVGRSLVIEGRPFRIVGVLAREQPARPVWDVCSTGAKQDALYLPFGWFRRLLARPEHPVFDRAPGDSFAELLASPTQFVSFWKQLGGPAERAAYQRYLEQQFPGRHQLRDYAQWRQAFAFPLSDVRFYVLLTGLALLGGGANAARLLLAKGYARRGELGLHRALGATRLSLFVRQMMSATLLALPAALLGVALAVPYAEVFNHMVELNDVPVRMTPAGFLQGFVPAVLVGIASAAYPAWWLSRTGPSHRPPGGG